MLQREFIKETTSELIKHTRENVNVETVLEMVEDIVKFFDGIEEEYKTLQQYVGIRNLFRGFIVKDWKGADFNCTMHTIMNKILIKKAV